MTELIALCRAGFEKEVAAELNDVARAIGISGYVNAKSQSGLVRFVCLGARPASEIIKKTDFQDLIFIRHWFTLEDEVVADNDRDRVSPVVERCLTIEPVSALLAVAVDTNEGKSLAKLTRGVARHVERRLKAHGHWSANSKRALHLLFLSATRVVLGQAPSTQNTNWPGGVPRLRAPRQAPSRASIKLEEAWLHFLLPEERDVLLAPGMRAADLGAAPGGWTWQLVNKSMFVDAVDNGPMNESLMASGQVTHHRTDGFAYRPAKTVDWLVCDIADKPLRVANLIVRWVAQGWCRHAIFNLKLPMKQRYAIVREAERQITEVLQKASMRHCIRFKQLYHDREEVTGYLRLY